MADCSDVCSYLVEKELQMQVHFFTQRQQLTESAVCVLSEAALSLQLRECDPPSIDGDLHDLSFSSSHDGKLQRNKTRTREKSIKDTARITFTFA